MAKLPRLPLSRKALRRYRIEARKRLQAGQVGAHLVRRRGQSLEFRNFARYTPGDDFRHIDWQASARHGLDGELLVRQFNAEEALDLLISIDNRPSMSYPWSAPKIRLACWLACAVTVIANAWGDRVRLHRLFGDSGKADRVVRDERAALTFLDQLAARPNPETDRPNLGRISRILSPTSVWLILSDLYFDDHGALARAIRRAERGLCWVIVYDLDSWPSELKALGRGARRILGPSARHSGREVEIGATTIKTVEQQVTRHKELLLPRECRRRFDCVHWPWPAEEQPDGAALFKQRFLNDAFLRRLFRKQQ